MLGTSFLMCRVSQPTDVCGEKYFEERRGKVIDALYVPAGRMSYRPDVQYTFQRLAFELAANNPTRIDHAQAIPVA